MNNFTNTTSIIKSANAMQKFGEQLAKKCLTLPNQNLVIFLEGNLGSGKTTFTRGFLRGVGYTGKVKSPTFTIVEPYQIKSTESGFNSELSVHHFDLYRLNDPMELENIGIRDYISHGINLIEWPEKALNLLPTPDLICKIDFIENNPQHRKVEYEVKS